MARQPIELATISPLARSANPVNTYVQHYADPNAGKGLEDLAKALGIAAETAEGLDAKRSKEFENNLQYYASEFSRDRDLGMVDATQVGKAYPDASPVVTGKVTELVGKQWANDYVRSKFDSFLADENSRTNPEARRQFFAGLRAEVAKQVEGRPFFGNGALTTTEAIIREYENSFQREAGEYSQKLQEEDFKTNIAAALKGQPVSIMGAVKQQQAMTGGQVVSSTTGKADPSNFLSTTKSTQEKTRQLSALFGKPIRITPHGGTQADRRSNSSQHHHGTATDIYIADYSDEEKEQLVALAIANGAKGIGSYSAGDGKGTIHVDYRKGGKHFGDQIKGGLALWHRNKPGVDDSWKTAPEWFQRGVLRGVEMRKQGVIPQSTATATRSPSKTQVGLLELIGRGESGGNYDAYHGHGDNKSIRFTAMTVDEVLDWQQKHIASGATSSAVGRYQFLRGTLRGLKSQLKLAGDEKFTPELQDNLALALMENRGLKKYQSGKISKEDFANELAKEWAALPVVSGARRGRSHYDGDNAGNRAQVSVDEFMSAIDGNTSVVDPVAFLDGTAGQTTSINPIRRRELVVSTAIDMALADRDTSILDRIPENMRGMPDIEARIAKTQEQIRDLAWQDYTRQNQIEAVERDRQNRIIRQEILDKLAEGERINPADYAKFGDNVYDFAVKVQNDEFVDPLASAAKAAKVRNNLLQYSTNGSFTTTSGNELQDLDQESLIRSIQEADGLTISDKKKLIDELPTLMEGVNLLNDPQVSSFYSTRIGTDIQIYLQSVGGSLDKIQGNNIAGSVRRTFDDSLRAYVRASIEDGEGIPRGFRLIELMERAEEKALKKLETLTSRKTDAPAQESQSKPKQSSSKTTDLTSEEEDLLNKYLKANKDK